MNKEEDHSIKNIQEKNRVTIRFAGDSGDGIQLTGSQFSTTAALFGNDLSTFPDFPAEIRAPLGTLEGVSGYQVQIGAVDIHTPGDRVDVLAVLNPAALKSNLHYMGKVGTIIVNTDSFDKRNVSKAGFKSNPLEDDTLEGYNVVKAPISSLTRKALEGMPMSKKSILQCKNMFVLGMVYWLFGRSPDYTESYINVKFKDNSVIALANKKVLHTGYNFAETIEAFPDVYYVPPAPNKKGTYRHISGNIATAWGLMAATEKMGRKLFFGSYPITPASNILHELSRRKDMGVITLQAEDEIAAICSAIGASYAGQLGATASSGPGIVLKGEAIGLAIMAEIPLVIINVQRGGPSTGLPTKSEQTDINLALYGRNGESPAIVLAASTPSNCFDMAYEAAKLTVEHNTPVILLTDGYLANGSESWNFPKTEDLDPIKVPIPIEFKDEPYMPYRRDANMLSRYQAIPGTPGMEHRIGGLEKKYNTGHVSYDPQNHEKMVNVRAEKVKRVARFIPTLKTIEKGQLLVVGWGGTYGSLRTAIDTLQKKGKSVYHVHFNYINPLPENTEATLSGYDKIMVCELNQGQFASYLRSCFPGLNIQSYTKVQGVPFTVMELTNAFLKILNG